MSADLSKRIYELMSSELSELGPHIVRKKCKELEIDPDNLQNEDLPKLAKALSEVMADFGQEKAKAIYVAINKLQNLETIVEDEKDEKKKMEGFLDLGDFARFSGEYSKAKQYYQKLLKLCQENCDASLSARANTMLGMLMNDMNEPNKAIGLFMIAQDISQPLEDSENLALSFRGLGYSNWRLGNYEESLRLYALALEHSRTFGNHELTGIIHIDMGLVYDTQGKADEALDSFNKAIKLLKETGNIHNLARAYNNVGEVFKNKGELEKAIANYEMCYKIAGSENYTRMMGYALGNSAECLAKMGRTEEARDKADQTLEIFEKYDDKYMISGVHLTYGIIHLKEGNKQEMDKSFGNAIQMLEELNFPYEIGTNTYQYSMALKELGHLKEAKVQLKKAYATFIELGSENFITKIENELKEL